MIIKQIRINGKHGDYLKKYSKDKQGDNNIPFPLTKSNGKKDEDFYLFETKMECYLVAAMIGIINKKTAEADHSNNPPANIFAEKVNSSQKDILRVYQHLILSETEDEHIDSAIKKVFSIKEQEELDIIKILEPYVRGGLEVIDSVFGECQTYEDVGEKMIDFIQMFNIEEASN